ncbi:hypothetical protein BGZ95_006088 [Linnemannia exigua]|uniref:Uncharacterized protein n=1 Tax=Linnemannia exigua TaxID=604196 RepID=A0AAD4GZZ3_9FUNG|nr:hypothetical protein BGZ95_006088 [Linnemannia exigua]
MVAESTRKNLIIAGSVIVSLSTIGAVAYLLIQDDRQTKHLRSLRALQKQLSHSLQKVETDLQTLLDNDVRLAQVRTKTLRQHPIYPGDPHVHLPSLGLISEQDQKELGEDVKETEEELVRERSPDLGFGQDSARVRQGYKKLDFLVQSINERLLRLLESLDAISPRELTDIGDGFGGIVLANGPEVQAFEKIRKRKRSDIARIQKLMAQMDQLAGTFKDRLVAVEVYEKKAAEAEAEAKEKAAAAAVQEAEEKAKKEKQEKHEQEEKTNGHVAPAVAALVQPNISFAEIASHNIPQPEVLAPTEDLEKMKEGVSFADVVAAHQDEESSPAEEEEEEEEMEQEHRDDEFTIEIQYEAVLAHNQQLKRVKEGVLFSEVVSHAVEETQEQEQEQEAKVAIAATEETLAAEIAAAL